MLNVTLKYFATFNKTQCAKADSGTLQEISGMLFLLVL